MAVYIANPIFVDAFKIVSIDGLSPDDGSILLTTEDGVNRIADKGMIARYVPKVNDYWVIQEDGYEYVNPKDVFERKYSLYTGSGLSEHKLARGF